MMGFYWITASFFLILPFYFFKLPIYCLNPQIDNPSTCIRTCLLKQLVKINVPSSCASPILTISRIMCCTSIPLHMDLAFSVGIISGEYFIRYILGFVDSHGVYGFYWTYALRDYGGYQRQEVSF